MKKTLRIFSIIFLFVFFGNATARAQVTVTSSKGYTVYITITPRTIVNTGSDCPSGYNYNVNLDYTVTFTGSNQPTSLYALQGTIGCGFSSHFFDLPEEQGAGNVTSKSNVWRGVSDCSTATVSSLLCNTGSIEIEGPGISHQVITFNIGSTLPVTLASFSAQALQNKVKIMWATATEMNSDHFIVERSTDGTTWSAIKTVTAAGNSSITREYEVYDEKPFKGAARYRLKQVDMDGRTEYSATRTVKYNNGAVVDVYPVPNSGNSISFAGLAEPSNTVITVQNLAGERLYNTTLSSNSAVLPPLKPGMYIIRMINKTTGEATSLRYMKI